MIREFNRKQDGKWCSIKIELRNLPLGPELAISGAYGSIVTRKTAEKMALEYWVSFFEDEPSEIYEMGERFGKHFCNAKQAAKFVIATDGPLHWLDVEREVDGQVYLTEGWGQCTDELEKWFPECVPYLKFHLNGMQSGCKHQRQNLRGWEVGEVCGECGYAYGSKWLHAEIPESVIEWAVTFNG
jgi:hypothetical protein